MPAKRRPRPWSPIDREYLTQDTIRELGQRFGSRGPLVFLAIILEVGKTASGGVAQMRFGALATQAFTDAETAREIVCAAADVGLIVDLVCDERRFSGRLARWDAWEVKDEDSARRSAAYRARQRDETP